ncbi:MAG: accessory gene regulator B family protein, partial [Natronincolaceae bacterium]
MEKLAKGLADNIGKNLQYDSEKTAVVAYGLTAAFQMFTIFFVLSIVGSIWGFWAEGMIIFILVGLLRKSVGGAHSKT